jgi:hypothetical protein
MTRWKFLVMALIVGWLILYKIIDNAKKKKTILGICAIVRNSNNLLREWIVYHHELGIDQFILYDNNDSETENITMLLEPLPKVVTVIPAPGKMIGHRQMDFYRDCRRRSQHIDWLMQLDIDEMIVLKGTFRTLRDIFYEYGRFYDQQISFRWEYTCTWNRIASYTVICEKEPIPVTTDFEKEVKSFYRPSSVYTRHSVHHMSTLELLKNEIEIDVGSIYHFYARSLTDFRAAKFYNNNDWNKANFIYFHQIAALCIANNYTDEKTSLVRANALCKKDMNFIPVLNLRPTDTKTALYAAENKYLQWLNSRLQLNRSLDINEIPLSTEK